MAITADPRFAVSLTATGATRAFFNRLSSVWQAGRPALALSAGGGTFYGVNRDTRNNQGRVFRFTGDGSTTAFTLPTAATGVTYPTTAAASLDSTNYLQAIMLSGVGTSYAGATLLERVGSDATPSGSQWKINGTTVTFAIAPAAGVVVELYIPDTANIVQITGGSLSAGIQAQFTCYTFMTVSAATQLEALALS